MRVKLPSLLPIQDEIRRNKARFKVLACGRRFGKTQLCAVLALGCALSGGIVWWVAPTSEITRRGWEKIEPLAKMIPGSRIRYADREIHVPGGGWIAFRSATGDSLRGPGVDLLILDEAAFITQQTWNAELRATLSDRKGQAVFISTPDGRNWFHDFYLRGKSDDPKWRNWAGWQLKTEDNPVIDPDEIAEAKAELPEWYFQQEYEAAFQTFAGKVYKTYTPEGDCNFSTLDPSIYTEHWGGIDFGFTNPSVICVGGLDRDDRMDVVDGTYQSGLTTPDLIDILRGYQDKYSPRRWFADPADPGTIKELRNAGLPVVPSPRIKGALERSFIKSGIVKVETRLVNGRLRIYDGTPDEFTAELDGYRYPAGGDGKEVKETPLKVHDHFPDALRYMVVGLDHLRGRVPRVRVAA